MNYRTPFVITGMAVAAASPILLHGHPTRDCVLRVELCGVPEMGYWPDEQAPHNAPLILTSPLTIAGSTATAPSSAVITYPAFRIV